MFDSVPLSPEEPVAATSIGQEGLGCSRFVGPMAIGMVDPVPAEHRAGAVEQRPPGKGCAGRGLFVLREEGHFLCVDGRAALWATKHPLPLKLNECFVLRVSEGKSEHPGLAVHDARSGQVGAATTSRTRPDLSAAMH